MEELIQKIKQKKELKYIDESFVKRILSIILKNNPNISRDQLIKEARKLLHEFVGIYEVIEKNDVFKKFFKKLEKNEITKFDIIKILNLSWSTRERSMYYEKIYRELFSLTPKDKVIIFDIACGLNPFSIWFILDKVKKYFAIDISVNIVNWVNEFLTKVNRGYAKVLDLFNLLNDDLTKVNYDFVFLWKTVPIIERIQEGFTKELLLNLSYDFFIISFSKKTLGLRRYQGRAWTSWSRKLAKEIGIPIVKTFEIPNEIFIVFKKGF